MGKVAMENKDFKNMWNGMQRDGYFWDHQDYTD